MKDDLIASVAMNPFVKRAKQFHKDIRYLWYMGCDHGFMEKVGVLPQAEEVLLDLASFLKNL